MKRLIALLTLTILTLCLFTGCGVTASDYEDLEDDYADLEKQYAKLEREIAALKEENAQLKLTAEQTSKEEPEETPQEETPAIPQNSAPALDEALTYYADIDIADYGKITVKLDQAAAPATCANFVNLVQKGFYNGLTFHRIMEGFMMQGGCPNGNGSGSSAENVVGEFAANGYENDLSHTRGAISMARASDPNSGSCQFFIVHADSLFLDGSYACFGYVTEGLDVVDAVCEKAEPTDDNGTIPADAQPVITSITIRTESAN